MKFVEGTPEYRLQEELGWSTRIGDDRTEVNTADLTAVLDSLSTARGLTAELIEHEPERPSEFGCAVVAVSKAGRIDLIGPFHNREEAEAAAPQHASDFDNETYHAVDLVAIEGDR